MSRKRVNINKLSDLEKSNLQDGWAYGKSHSFRNRCQAILLSNEDYNTEELVKVFSVSKNTIYTWIKKWKNQGITGLITKPGQGRKPTLSLDNETHIKVVETAVKNAAVKGVNMKEEIIEKLGLENEFSDRTLHRFLQKKTMRTKGFVDTVKNDQIQRN